MESTIHNQSSISENESDARYRIRDTDFASDMVALTQANRRPTIALSFMGGYSHWIAPDKNRPQNSNKVN